MVITFKRPRNGRKWRIEAEEGDTGQVRLKVEGVRIGAPDSPPTHLITVTVKDLETQDTVTAEQETTTGADD